MTYRDEQEALRARLEATEQRLRETEHELAEVRRRLEEPAVVEPSTPPPASRRVGHLPPAPVLDGGMARTLLGAGGLLLSLLGIAFVLWNLPAAEHVADIGGTLLFAFMTLLAPGGLLVFLSLRRPRRALHAGVAPLRARIAVPVGEANDADELEEESLADPGEEPGEEMPSDALRAETRR